MTGRIAPFRPEPDTDHPPLHLALRAATRDIHDRLHRHAGFAAVQSATIGLAGYRALLVRLYGFYRPFEAAAAIPPDRTQWLANDLNALGLTHPLHALPFCPQLPRLDTPQARLGALYVAEGSALGGRDLARGLDPLLGRGVTHGRHFFIGRGEATGIAWRHHLALLSAASPCDRAGVLNGAIETFAAFEHWLSGWSTDHHGRT